MQLQTALDDYANSLSIGQHKKECPMCAHTRKKNKRDKCLSIKVFSDRMIYSCHHCQEQGVYPFNGREKVQLHNLDERKMQKLDVQKLSAQAIEWLEGRGISKKVAEEAKLFSSNHWINAEGAVVPCIGFPYEKGKVSVGAKIRSLKSKGFSCTSALHQFFNINSIGDGDYFVICEGEMDALSFIQAGIKSAVSVPNGAVAKMATGPINPDDDKTFNFLWDSKEKLDNAKKIIIATDADSAGNAMAEELARRIGRDRCWRIVFPDGYKDANEVLIDCGEEFLSDLVDTAEPWPISGIYDTNSYMDEIYDLYENGIGSGLSTGFLNLDDFYTVASGQLTIVTGSPSSGKSEFIDQLMMNQAMQFGKRFAVCSFENLPKFHIPKLISKYHGKPFDKQKVGHCTQDEIDTACEFIQDHFYFVRKSDSDFEDLDDLLERLRISVLRYGIDGAVIDPYNYIRRNTAERETDWISEMLTKIRMFAQAYDIHIWFVAHPAKPLRDNNGKTPIPKGYDISGSAAWFAKADCGLTVHREMGATDVEIHVWKCRHSWVGKQGVSSLKYDTVTTRYREIGFADRYSAGTGATKVGTDADFPAPF